MYKIAKSKARFILSVYIIFLCLCIANSINFNHWVIALMLPVVLLLTSFFLGSTRINLRFREIVILFTVNAIFLCLTYRSIIFILNIYIISLLMWMLLTPYLIKFKNTFTAAIGVLVFLSFYIPYYRLPAPLLSFLYYPFYFFGYVISNIEIIKCKITKTYLTISLIISSLSLLFILSNLLKTKERTGFIYIQSLYNRKDAFVYSPIIVISFLILSFSALILFRDNLIFEYIKETHVINIRAALVSSCGVLPLLLLVKIQKLNHYQKSYLFIVLMTAYLVMYIILNSILKASFCKKFEAFEFKKLNLKTIYSKILFIITFMFLIVTSIEFIVRGLNIKSTINYINSTSFLYNIIFVTLIYLLAIAVVGIKLGSLLLFIFHSLLVLGNYIKLKYLNEPFYFWDTYLIRDMFIISKEYINPTILVILVAFLVIFIILILKNIRAILKVVKPIYSPKLVLLILAPLIFNIYLVNNNKLININIAKDWYDGIDEFLKNGTYVESYLYLKDLDKYLNNKPKEYSQDKISKIEKEFNIEENSSNIQPNVIVVLSETYWDLNNLKDIKIDNQINNNLTKYRNATLISPSFGWETANVEFEVLTGFSNFYFNKGIIPYNIYFNRNIPSIVSAFNNNGYDTVAIHPNTGSMYNRAKVYKHLGFNDFKDISSFDKSTDIKGSYISDDKVVDKIINILKEGEKPKFIFAATIQNHDPYDKASRNYKNREVNVKSDKLNHMEVDILSNFAQGEYDADKALGKLIDEVSKINEPTLVYYFGDHLPRLGLPEGIFDIYEKLGYVDEIIKPESDIKFYETPLVTWSNYKKMNKIPNSISPNQLAIEILRNAEIRYPDYFNYLLKLREKYPYLNKHLINKDSIINEKIISDYYLIQYDIMFGNMYLGKSL